MLKRFRAVVWMFWCWLYPPGCSGVQHNLDRAGKLIPPSPPPAPERMTLGTGEVFELMPQGWRPGKRDDVLEVRIDTDGTPPPFGRYVQYWRRVTCST